MADITHGTWIKDGKAVDAVYQGGVKVYGRNLWSRSKAVSGYLVYTGDGSVYGPDAENLVSDFISVDENQTYVYHTDVVITNSSKPQSWDAYAFFDSNKIALGSRPAQMGPNVTVGTPQHTEWVIKAPVGASFIRIGSRYLEQGKAKLEVGSVPTPWTPAPEDVLK